MTTIKTSRRELLIGGARGLGALTVGFLMPGGGLLSAPVLAADIRDPLAPKPTHFPARATSVIWLHMDGAPSTLDLWDHKPDLIRLSGQDIPESFLEGLKTSTQGGVGKLFASKERTWKQYGQSGAWFSNLLPHLSQHADAMTFIKASTTIGATHDISILKMNTGDVRPGRPSLGAWVQYALGSANPDLPAYVVLYSGRREPDGGSVNWSSGFLPAVYQGVPFRPGDSPIFDVNRLDAQSERQQRSSLDLLRRVNDRTTARYPEDSELRARSNAYDLAYRMQSAAPEAVDLARETDATKALYGLDADSTRDYGTTMLRARRLVERGVRFVHVVSGNVEVNTADTNWDAHQDLDKNHAANARAVDKPIAALLADLKARGLLDTTLVVWTSEFGRTSYGQSGNGRDHNPWGYTQWMAGGGARAGFTYGQTDEVGLQSVGKAVDTYDLHATVLHLLGLDHLKVTYQHSGRSERPTIVHGEVFKDLIA